ncbi:hypothetical protein HOLleu_39132 [Holothuria leucospilota]|uniref:Uncharacterized protein n=1 Tax=Holothuria leucospilota TaxID=206669 RepID=A0A9Q1BE44_HOLLE|nr:hypothetical protein HOLleu_39132 [Holothuria leucospilota]
MDVTANMGSLSMLLLLGAIVIPVDASNDTGVCNTTKLSESSEFTLEKVDVGAQVLSPCLPANLTALRLQTKGDLVRMKLLEPPVDIYLAYRDKDAGNFQMVQRDKVPVMYAQGENSTVDFCDKEVKTVVLFVSPLEGQGPIEKVLPEHLQVTVRGMLTPLFLKNEYFRKYFPCIAIQKR